MVPKRCSVCGVFGHSNIGFPLLGVKKPDMSRKKWVPVVRKGCDTVLAIESSASGRVEPPVDILHEPPLEDSQEEVVLNEESIAMIVYKGGKIVKSNMFSLLIQEGEVDTDIIVGEEKGDFKDALQLEECSTPSVVSYLVDDSDSGG